MYSKYASSSATITWAGTAAMNASSSCAGIQVPVGLFGFATNTTRVAALIARAIAARSWPSGMLESGPSAGTATPVAPVAWTAMG